MPSSRFEFSVPEREHLREVFKKFVLMDEGDNEALLRVLATMLEYSAKERKAMQLARERRLARRTSLFGFG